MEGPISTATLAPASSEDESPSEEQNEQKNWYQKGSFIIAATLSLTLLLVGGAFHIWLLRKRTRKRRGVEGGVGNGKRINNDDIEYNYGVDSGQDYDKETDSLLGGKGYGTTANSPMRDGRFINSPFSDDFDRGRSPLKINNQHGYPNQSSHFNPLAPSIKERTSTEEGDKGAGQDRSNKSSATLTLANARFLNFDIGAGNIDQNGVLRNFADILKVGLVLSLHTLKGPKPVLFTMLNGEVRWQAVKMAQKRYKIALKDIHNVEEGKLTDNFARSSSGDESCCFSLITAKTTLDLEASCEVDRNCLVFGFRHHIRSSKTDQASETEDAFL